jgi:hypothetical protein
MSKQIMCFEIAFVIYLFLTFNRIIAQNDSSHKLLSHDLSERSIEGMSLPSLSIIITYSRIIISKNAFK